MKKTALILLLGAGMCLRPAHVTADDDAVECVKSATFLAPLDSAGRRKYAPDREVEVLHLALDITPDFDRRTIAGRAVVRVKPIIKPVQELKLDAVDLDIRSVTATQKLLAWQVTTDHVVITFAQPLTPEQEAAITIAYGAEPKIGLYFRTPGQGYKEGDAHLFTQGEEIDARYWYPCFDSPNEKFTSEVTCHVPDGMTVISNGRLVDTQKDSATGLTAVHWSQEKPHANYLISLVAGYFSKLEDKHRDVPLTFYVVPSESAEAANSFRDTKAIMDFYEQEIGVPYPWPKYSQVCVNDFVEGGMENTSATTLTDTTLFTDASENIRDSEGLVAHEMAHQWFGDLVTCKDWGHIWLNEGFATYYATLFSGHKEGRDALLYGLYQRNRQLTSTTNASDVLPIVRRDFDAPHEMFGSLTYAKASMVLNMLCCELGEDLYRRCIKTYLERHRYGNVVTDDLREVIEELSGRSYDQFFDQWLYHGHFPELDAAWSWDERNKLAKVTIRQTQKLSEDVLLFDFPLAVRFTGDFGNTNCAIHVKDKEEDFYFPLASAPQIVLVDPECSLLAKISFTVPNAMLFAQLTNQDDVVSRLRAVDQLADKKDKETVSRLKEALGHDSFYGVRLEASRALHSIHTDEALDALLASTEQSDARVRRQVATDIGSFYRNKVYDWALKSVDQEKNPEIVSAEIRELGAYTKPASHDVLLKYLHGESFRNELADASIEAMRAQDDPAWIAPLLDTLREKETNFTSRGFGMALNAVAYLARNEEKRDQVCDFLLGHLNDKKRTIEVAAIRALGTLGDARAIAPLEGLATESKESMEQRAAEGAVATLRAGRKPVDDFKNLREEVVNLEKENRGLRRDVDALKKEVEARSAGAPGRHATNRPVANPPKNR